MSENGLWWRVVSGFIAAAFLPVSGLFAASGTWTGAENALWTNSANWSAAPYPGEGTGETAVFDGPGNGNTLVGLDGLARIFNVSFDGASAAAYTLGTGGADVQTLTVDNSGTLAVSNSVINSQTVQASVRLGTNTAAGTYNFLNSSAESTLTFEGGVSGGATGGTAGTKTLNLNGNGRIVINGILSNGGASSLTLNSYGTNTLAGDNTFSGSIIVYDGTLRLTHSNALGTGTKTASANNNFNGRNPSFVLDGSAGNLSIPANVTFQTSNSRAGAIINEAGDNTILGNLRLTSGDGATHLWSKGGKLTISGDLTPTETSRQLYLRGDSDGEISGVISNGATTTGLPLLRDVGSGTWTLSGANVYSGSTTVSAGTLAIAGVNGSIAASASVSVSNGATFRVENTVAANLADRVKDTAAVRLNDGIFAFVNDGGGVDFSETVGALTLSGGTNAVITSQAAEGQTSVLTFSGGLSRSGMATVNFVGEGLGTSRNRIFIAGQADGLIGFWSTYNGTSLAMYDSVRGVYGSGEFAEIGIAARGPSSVIPDDASASVRITSAGESGPITLAGETVSRVALLTQATGTPAVIDTASKAFLAHGLAVEAGQASLTVGVAVADGTLTAASEGGRLVLANASESALAVNATLADNAQPVSVDVSGPGEVVFNGATLYTGTTAVNNGALVFGGHAVSQTVTGVVSGNGSVVKRGTNLLYLTAANTYTGPTYLNEGVTRVDKNTAFGTSAGGVVIAPGATLDVGANLAANNLNLGAEQFTVSGTGVGGRGAIVNNSSTSQYAVFGRVTLAGDTTFGGTTSSGRFDIRNNTPTLTLNDFTLTKTGPNMFGLTSANVVPGAGHIDVREGTLRFEANTRMNGGPENTFTVRSGATLELYSHYPQNATLWSLVCENNASLRATLGTATSNDWAGPVTLQGTLKMWGGGSYHHTVSGPISGPGSIIKYSSSTANLTGDANTYKGFTWITNGTMRISSIRNLGEASSLGAPETVENGTINLGSGATSVTLVYQGTGDTSDRVLDLAGTTGGATINHSGSGLLKLAGGITATGDGSKTLTVSGSSSGTGEISGTIQNPASGRVAITKSGTGTWVLSGNNTFTGDVNVAAGVLTLSGSNAQGNGRIAVGSSAGSAVLKIAPGAAITGAYPLRIGSTGGSQAAAYMEGGSVRRTTQGTSEGLIMGVTANTYGSFMMSGGELAFHRIQTGASGTTGGSTNIGMFRMTGGVATITNYLLLARGVGSQSAFTIEGGTLYFTNTSERISLGYEGGRAEVNLTGGSLLSTTNLVVRQSANGSTGIVNLCSGTLAINLIQNTSPGVAILNFAGGTLKAGVVNSTAFIPSNMTGVYSYGSYGGFAGGAVIDTVGRNVTVAAQLRAPAGDGVYSITLADKGSGYIGEPYIHITEGGGVGATAVANMEDDGTGNGTFRVASITMTSPGTGYTSTPIVLFRGGGTSVTEPTIDVVALSPNTSGGLTKQGNGVLTLGAANTYTGVTTVAGGTLKLGNAAALPTQTRMVLAGGTLDLSGYTVTNMISGVGTLTNGTLRAALSPAGSGVIGTETLGLTLNNAAVQIDTYVVDVATDGTCDSVAVQGSITLSGIALQLVNPGLLERTKTYTILTCTGTRTGTFASTNLPADSRWRVIYGADGSVKLFHTTGTVVLFR